MNLREDSSLAFDPTLFSTDSMTQTALWFLIGFPHQLCVKFVFSRICQTLQNAKKSVIRSRKERKSRLFTCEKDHQNRLCPIIQFRWPSPIVFDRKINNPLVGCGCEFCTTKGTIAGGPQSSARWHPSTTSRTKSWSLFLG